MREAGVQQQLTDLTSLWRIRHFEERVQDLRMSGEIAGSVHLCYRGHGWAIACGAPLPALLGELLGRAASRTGHPCARPRSVP